MYVSKIYKQALKSLLYLSLPAMATVNAQNVQCTSGTLYGVTQSNQQGLYLIDPATEATTLVNANIFGGGAAKIMADAGGQAGTSAIALDIHTNILWFSNRGNGTDPIPKIFSYNLTTNSYGTVFGTYAGITSGQNFNKAAYNPVDKKVYFHNASSNHLFRFDPATPAVPAADLGVLSVPGFTVVGNYSGGDIAFDGLGNLTGAFNNANILAIFPAQYDAAGNYTGLSLAGQQFAPLSVSPSSVAFLTDGNYAVGSQGGSSIVNTNTGVQTDLGALNFGSSDFTSCAAPSPNLLVTKSAVLDCITRTLTYTITISNTGQFHAINTRLIDALPAGVTLNSATLNGASLVTTGLATTGVPVKSSQAQTDGQLLKGDVATIVLSCSLAPGTSGPVSSQAFVKYNGVESLNLPNDRIPSNDPATPASADPTVVTGCYTLSGTVFNDNNGSTDGPNGTLMPGVTVTLYASDGTTVVATTTTDANGNYNFSTQPGNYVVGVTPPTNFAHISSTDGTQTDGKTAATVTNAAVGSVNFGLNQPPVATDNTVSGLAPGSNAVLNTITNDDTDADGTVVASTVNLIPPAAIPAATGTDTDNDGDIDRVTVPGEGTWNVAPDGTVTFIPEAGFTADPTPITYTVKDNTGLTSNAATLRADYNVPPVANDNAVSGLTPGANAVLSTITGNDTDPDGTVVASTVNLIPPAAIPTATGTDTDNDGDIDRVTVPGEGTWNVAPDGTVTFTPEAGFTGDPTPVTYTVKDNNGLSSNPATLTVDYDQAILADYGDLPYSGAAVNYPKVKAHFKDANNDNVPDDAAAVWLGQIVDGETDGFTSPSDPADYAKGDDNNGMADEDGLKVEGLMQPGTVTWTITANSNQPATVHYGVWVDWGTSTAMPDGTFDDFYTGTIATASPATQAVSIAVPATFQQGALVNVRIIASPTPLDQNTGFSTDLSNGEIEDYQMTFAQAMPVRLVSFRADATETGVNLTWKAADQENFDRYEIERSHNGKDFGRVGIEASNNQKSGTYTFTDNQALSVGSTLYYRLKMVDIDESFAYSSIRTVSFKNAGAISAVAWPTLVGAGDPINVMLSGYNGPYEMAMFNNSGIKVSHKQAVLTSRVEVATKGLPMGTYLIKVSSAGWQKTMKISIVK